MNPNLIEQIFSTESSLSSLPSLFEQISEIDSQRLDTVFKHMERINPIEADMVELHMIKKVPQATLGKIFGYTQPNVHYRLGRGVNRLRVLLSIPIFSEADIRKRLSGYLTDQKDIEVMTLIYVFSSQSEVARRIGESQGKVRYRYLRCIESLSRSPKLEDLYLAIKAVGDNLNLLRKAPKLEEKIKVIL